MNWNEPVAALARLKSMKSAKVRLSGGSHAATRLTPRRYRGRTLNRDEPLPPGPPPPLSAEGSSPLRSPPAAATASVPATASVLVSALALAPGLAPGQAWAACESAFALFWIFMYFGPQRANRELAGCHKGKGKHEDRKGKTLSTVHWRSPRCFCTSHVHVKLGGGGTEDDAGVCVCTLWKQNPGAYFQDYFSSAPADAGAEAPARIGAPVRLAAALAAPRAA